MTTRTSSTTAPVDPPSTTSRPGAECLLDAVAITLPIESDDDKLGTVYADIDRGPKPHWLGGLITQFVGTAGFKGVCGQPETLGAALREPLTAEETLERLVSQFHQGGSVAVGLFRLKGVLSTNVLLRLLSDALNARPVSDVRVQLNWLCATYLGSSAEPSLQCVTTRLIRSRNSALRPAMDLITEGRVVIPNLRFRVALERAPEPSAEAAG
ncbi:MAG TPA: hypothetical protein PKC43_06645 [Phycisphaerales bacterium]|nr:hypothetical protein [Phycisphaerales bacterium]HMP37110.1 hypothetical protein [Phycisphaerales bacterium]